jgi:hypothetical protein
MGEMSVISAGYSFSMFQYLSFGDYLSGPVLIFPCMPHLWAERRGEWGKERTGG